MPRLYKVDESYFDCIDSEEKAYWLGFITADGGIVDGCLHLNLQLADRDHLEKVKLSMSSEHPVKQRRYQTLWTGKDGSPRGGWYERCCLKISSVRMVRALARLGVTAAKSHIVRPCPQVPSQLLRHYWRGVFDGDGSITKKRVKKRWDQWSVTLAGNRFMVGAFVTFLKTSGVSTQATPHWRYRQTWTWTTGGIGVCTPIMRLLYEGATIALDRKAHRAMLINADATSSAQRSQSATQRAPSTKNPRRFLEESS